MLNVKCSGFRIFIVNNVRICTKCRSQCNAVRWLRGVTGHVNKAVWSERGGGRRAAASAVRDVDSRARCLPVVWQWRRERGARPRPDLASTRIYWCVTARRDATYVPSYVRVCTAEPIQVTVYQFISLGLSTLFKRCRLFELRYACYRCYYYDVDNGRRNLWDNSYNDRRRLSCLDWRDPVRDVVIHTIIL